MHIINYSDMLISDLTTEILDSLVQDDLTHMRSNVAEDRVIVKWNVDNDVPSFVAALQLIVRNKADAIAYYDNPVNGWV